MNQWSADPACPAAGVRRAVRRGDAGAVQQDELHSQAAWIGAIVSCSRARAPAFVPSRAISLVDSFRDPGTDPSFRAAWRNAVPVLGRSRPASSIPKVQVMRRW